MPRRHPLLPLLLCLALGAALAAQDEGALPRPPQPLQRVAVVVNVLAGVEATDDDIARMIAKANRVLNQAGVRLEVKATRRGVADEGNNDGVLSQDDFDDVFRRGERELQPKPGEKPDQRKGFKLFLAKQLIGLGGLLAMPIEGFAPHDRPVAIIDVDPLPRDAGERRARLEVLGRRLAHEFCHAFTLDSGHALDPAQDGTDRRADRGGHVPDDETHLMDPLARGERLDRRQIEEIRRKLAERSQGKQKKTPAAKPEPVEKKTGEKLDGKSGEPDEGAGIAPHRDLRRALQRVLEDAWGALFSVQFHGLLPAEAGAGGELAAYFDLDADPATGAFVGTGGQAVGAELSLRITYRRAADGSVQTTAVLHDLAGDRALDAPPVTWRTEHLLIDVGAADADPAQLAVPSFGALAVGLPPGLFADTGVRSTVLVQSRDGEAVLDDLLLEVAAVDPEPLGLMLDRYLAAPGTTVTVSGQGTGPVDLRLDDQILATGLAADADGTFVHAFNAPRQPGCYWILATDAAGRDDFTILDVAPAANADAGIPVLPWLLGVAILLALVVLVVVGLRNRQDGPTGKRP